MPALLQHAVDLAHHKHRILDQVLEQFAAQNGREPLVSIRKAVPFRIEQIDVDSTNPNDPPHYREVRTVTANTLRFSLQFAQSFGPFTGRFGIKESKGGLGLDVLLFEDRFVLRQDLYGFGEVVLPRWRISLGYEFINRLWLLGGVEDILSNSRRDYFVGGMLRFNDEDLKTILPFAKVSP